MPLPITSHVSGWAPNAAFIEINYICMGHPVTLLSAKTLTNDVCVLAW